MLFTDITTLSTAWGLLPGDIDFENYPIINAPSIVSTVTQSPSVVIYRYSDDSEVQLYPKSMWAFERNRTAIYVDWSHRSAGNEWWYCFSIGNLKFRLFIHSGSVNVFFPHDATDDHIELIEEWVAGFPGLEATVIEYYLDSN